MAKRATFDELITFANKVRAAGGGNPIDALIPSVPSDDSACLIAQNLNFNCCVDKPNYGASWEMQIDNPDTVEKIAKELNLKVVYVEDGFGGDKAYAIELPPNIGQVAEDFDSAGELVNDLLYQWKNGGNLHYSNPVELADKIMTAEEIQLINDMFPYIEKSEQEARSLATVVNADGSIVV